MFQIADAERAGRVMIIAEIGVNHDGDASRAEQLICAAAAAGADAVKFQLFRPGRLLSAEALLATYQQGQAEDPYKLLEALTLRLDVMRRLIETAHKAGLRFLLTPFSLADVDDLAMLEVDAVKIASPDAVNGPLLRAAAALGRPMFISTGTCEMPELDAAAALAQRSGGALLHCVSAYPTPEACATLGAIRAMRQEFPAAAIGYSDHTTAEDTGALAVAAGAAVLEKHLTHDRQAKGPDHGASLEPDGFKRYVDAARRAGAMLGPIRKTCLSVEADVRKVSRQSVCVIAALPAGHVLTASDLTVKRPGTALPAAQLPVVLGRTLARPVAADHLLRETDLKAG